jgi:spore coat polysaccharide biosynthesis protein SpsF
MMRALAIVQARMGSTRLPGKVLADLCGRPMLEHLLLRLRTAPVDAIVVATTTLAEDDPLAEWVRASGLAHVYRGSAADVLDRFHHAALLHPCELVVRVTADDPLKAPELIAEAISWLERDAQLDYCSNTLHPTYPEGLDIEVVRARTLAVAHAEAKLPSEREHVTPFIWSRPERFRLHNFRYTADLSQWRWTVDKPQDLALMRAVFGAFGGDPLLPYQQAIDYIAAHPELAAINAGTIRNEGYLKSRSQEQE